MKKNATVNTLVWVLTLALLLAACAPVATAAPTATQPAAETPSPTATVLPPTPSPAIAATRDLSALSLPPGITLEFWHPWSGDLAAAIAEITDQFNRENQWGITVNIQVHADELVLLQDMNDVAAQGLYPDVVAAPSAYLTTWYRQGWPLLDLEPYVQSAEYGLDSAQMEAFLPVFWKNDQIDDVRLGLPAYRDGHFLFYNQSWAQQLGFDDYPQTSADFQAQACAAAAANLSDATLENNGTGGWLYDTRALSLLSWLRAFNGDELIGADGEISFTETGSEKALGYLFDLYNQDCSWTGKQSEPFQYFAGRYALFYSGDSRDIFTQELVDQNEGSQDDWQLIPYPSDDARPVVYADGDSYAVFQKDADRDLAAWLFLRYLSGTQNQVRVVEATGSLPLSTLTIGQLGEFRQTHPVWDQALQYLALAQPVPDTPGWMDAQAILSDMGWQLQYTVSRDSIPNILNEAERILQGN
ncbi:MAG: multiple sugar transport system substrate-binding protein [Chloroflexota bacterium]|nr:multiple sugar transport system substrate-binding protein [Chloroflexota bacterium]